jgi:hypothetical protein
MTKFNTAYNTRACRDFVMGKTIDALERAFHDGQLKASEHGGVWYVEGGASVIDAVPAFAHPLLLERMSDKSLSPGDSDDSKHVVLVSDMRPFGKWDPAQLVFRVRNTVEYNLTDYRTQLNRIWLERNPSLLRDVSQLPLSVYCSWVSESLAKRFALDPREQLNLAIFAGIFYCSLFSDTDNLVFDEREKLRITQAVSRAARASAHDVLKIIDELPKVTNHHEFVGIGDFCRLAADVSGSIRLKDLNVGLLFLIVGGTWFGTNAKEIIAVALEHPPTWLAILMAAASERTYRNSIIAKIIERGMSKDAGKNYMHSVMGLIAHNSK